ncbi:TPA: hypothetical protein SLF30_000171 [Acinetobacter baumannii]|nr:hypothetical protein [Acinetobacter baumannii]
MTRFIISDTESTSSTPLPTIFSFLSQSGKIAKLQEILAAEGKPTNIINTTNVDYIASCFEKYTSYVYADKGVIGSEAAVIQALAFAYGQSLAFENFSAFSAKYGYKITTINSINYVSKLYSLGAVNEMTVNIADGVQVDTDGSRRVLSFISSTAAFSSNKPLSLLNGIIAGTSCRDLGNVNTNSMRGVVLSGSSTTTTSAHTELGHNLPTGNYAKHYVASALTTIGDNAVGDLGYSGLATISKVGVTAKLWKNGSVVATGGTQMPYTLPNTFLFIANGNIASNKLYESWIIFSDSETIAANLSTYLNNS